MSAYVLSKLMKSFGSRTILDIDALTIEDGLIYALLGPNGAGKTTLLNILGFLDQPTRGKLTFKNRTVQYSESRLQKLRRNVVMVNQNPILFTTSVYKNLEFGLKIREIPKLVRKRIIEESLDLVGMRHLMKEPAHKLSGGETQRVVLARALALSPDVILCDEPTANVDPENQTIITDLLREINQEKEITLIFTSHNLGQAASLPHHTLYLDNGRINDLSYENIFHATFSEISEQNSLCCIQDELKLVLPMKKRGKARIHINPEMVSISSESAPTEGHSSHSGRIMQIRAEKNRIRLTVDCRIVITALITETEYRQQCPMVGDTVNLSISSQGVMVF